MERSIPPASPAFQSDNARSTLNVAKNSCEKDNRLCGAHWEEEEVFG